MDGVILLRLTGLVTSPWKVFLRPEWFTKNNYIYYSLLHNSVFRFTEICIGLRSLIDNAHEFEYKRIRFGDTPSHGIWSLHVQTSDWFLQSRNNLLMHSPLHVHLIWYLNIKTLKVEDILYSRGGQIVSLAMASCRIEIYSRAVYYDKPKYKNYDMRACGISITSVPK